MGLEAPKSTPKAVTPGGRPIAPGPPFRAVGGHLEGPNDTAARGPGHPKHPGPPRRAPRATPSTGADGPRPLRQAPRPGPVEGVARVEVEGRGSRAAGRGRGVSRVSRVRSRGAAVEVREGCREGCREGVEGCREGCREGVITAPARTP